MTPQTALRAGFRAFFVCSALLISMLTWSQAARADPFGGLAIGAGLDLLGTKINEAIEKAIGGALILKVQAGGQISVAIQQAKAAYESSLDKTWKDVDAQEQQALNSLATTADAFVDKTYTDIKDIEGRAQGIIHTLPFTKTFPQVYTFTPTYTTQDPKKTVHVELEGDFFDVVQEGLDSVLFVKDKQYKNSNKTNQLLTFDIPVGDLTSAPNAVASNSLKIDVPYKESSFLWFRTTKHANFSIPLMVLPVKFGTLSVQITTSSPGVAQQTYTTPQEYAQESGDDDIKCGGEHGDQAVHLAYPDSGWRVVPSSATWLKTWQQGNEGVDQDFWLASNCSSPTTACLCVSTEHHRAGTSGKVTSRLLLPKKKM